MLQSPAYAALPRSARKVLAAISTEIGRAGGDRAAITYETFMYDFHCGTPTQALRLLRSLGLIEVSAGRHLAGMYKLSDGWRAIDETEALRLLQLAREVRPVRETGDAREPCGG